MSASHRIPFQSLTSNEWRKLGLFAVIIVYVLIFLYSYIQFGVLNSIGSDYLSYWTMGKIADVYGFHAMYNVDLIKNVQYSQLSFLKMPFDEFSPMTAPYFAIFFLPFKFISRLDAKFGYWLLTIVFAVILFGYIAWFNKWILNQNHHTFNNLLVPLLFFSYPVFTNFIAGQVEVILLICTGHFIYYALKKREIRSGLWLGGLLLKPQVLVLIIPALILKKSWKPLIGFLISSIAIISTSLLLTGFDGMVAMAKLWLNYTEGHTYFVSPGSMANWRMIGYSVSNWSNSNIGWVFSAIGMVISLIIWARLSFKNYPYGSYPWIFNFLGIFAISCAFTWHSHIHMGMVLIPFLLILGSLRVPGFKTWINDLWVFGFPVAYLLGFFISVLIAVIIKTSNINLSGTLTAFTGLGIYMAIAIEAAKYPDKIPVDLPTSV